MILLSAGCRAALPLALHVGTVCDEDEPGEDDFAAYAASSGDQLSVVDTSISNFPSIAW